MLSHPRRVKKLLHHPILLGYLGQTRAQPPPCNRPDRSGKTSRPRTLLHSYQKSNPIRFDSKGFEHRYSPRKANVHAACWIFAGPTTYVLTRAGTSYNTNKLGIKSYAYLCGCGPVQLSAIRHNKVLKKRGGYNFRRCNQQLTADRSFKAN